MLATFLNRLRILLVGPIARLAFRYREYKRHRRRYPIEWKTPRDILFMDLENYEPEKGFELDHAMVKDLADARDKLLERIRKSSLITFTALAILVTDYFSIDLKFSLLGVEIKKFVFFRELLFLLTCGLSAHTMLLQSNQYTLENTIQFIISNKFPLELRHIYGSRYLPGMTYSRYIPTNLPYLNIVRSNYWVSMLPAYMVMILLPLVLVGYVTMIVLLLVDIWQHPSVQIWSRGAVIVMAISYSYGLLYVAATRLKLPYKNYVRLERQQVLKEYWPQQYQAEFGHEYYEDAGDEMWMKDRGYLPREREA